MVYVVDLLRRGDEHGNINIPIVRILAENKLADHIWISRDSTSNKYLLDADNNLLIPIEVASTKKYKWIVSTILTIKILIVSRKNKVGIFFLSTTPLHNLLITASTIFQRSSVRNYVLLHGELSYLINPVGFGRILGNFFLNLTFKILPFSKTTQVTLAYPVFIELKKRFNIDEKILINLELPTETIIHDIKLNKTKEKLRIGSFGVHSKDKSSHLIYDLAKYLENNLEQFEVVTIGVANTDFIYDQHPIVKHYCKGSLSDALIPRPVFLEEIKKLDFALFFYGNNPQYEMVSSGAFNDCINYEIPFAALSNNYLTHYLGKYGEIGFVRESLAELALELSNAAKDNSIIAVYKQNLRSARVGRSLVRFETQLLDIVKSSYSDSLEL